MSARTLAAPAAFDQVAAAYDAEFSDRRLGRLLRERVWDVLGAAFTPGMRVLELGCGTGEDAVWLARRGVRVLATDVSPGMLRVAAAKVRSEGLDDAIALARMDASDLAIDEQIDGVFANFGVLNCVSDLARLGQQLGRCLSPGAPVVAVVMGPFCAWETLWYAAHLDTRAFRRARHGALAHVGAASLPVWYPSPRSLDGALASHFQLRGRQGLGTLLPPSYLAGLVDRAPHVFELAAQFDGRMLLGPWWADHYMSVFERR